MNKCPKGSAAYQEQLIWLEQSAGHSYTAVSHCDYNWL